MLEEAVATVAQGGGRGEAEALQKRKEAGGGAGGLCASTCSRFDARIPRSLVMSNAGHFPPPIPEHKRCLSRERFSEDVCTPSFFFPLNAKEKKVNLTKGACANAI